MKRTIGAVIVAGVVAIASGAAAQVSVGLPPLSQAPVRLQVGGTFGNDAKSVAGSAVLGRRAAFGGVGLGVTSYDNLNGSSVNLSTMLGYEVPLGTSGRAAIAPVAASGIGLGPNDVFKTLDFSTQSVQGGFSVGALVAAGTGFNVLPSASVALVYSRETVKNTYGRSRTSSDTYGLFSGSLGLLFNEVFLISSGVHIPLGLDGADPVLSIAMGIAVGRGH